MLTPNGGVFGRNPKFNNVTVDGAATVGTNITLTNGNLILGTAGNGISFAAHPNAAGMTSELLDDYEEGTFTPTVQSGVTSPTYETQLGSYVKVGRLVHFELYIDLNGGTQAASALRFGGLPFTITGRGVAVFAYSQWHDTSSVLPLMTTLVNQTRIDMYTLGGLSYLGTDLVGIGGFGISVVGMYQAD